jgi:hypothetical protein
MGACLSGFVGGSGAGSGEGPRKARFTSLVQEGKMAEKNRKKTYLILIAILIVVLLITYL